MTCFLQVFHGRVKDADACVFETQHFGPNIFDLYCMFCDCTLKPSLKPSKKYKTTAITNQVSFIEIILHLWHIYLPLWPKLVINGP